ncbi:hypothetical protein F9288_18640 [Sphingomonas sp. CL5.1]|uniref:hypothetical protein n=1 Tax=Sphingomonas sp. CL5.1 TaxID=2653203 RepID=UPI001581E2D6|nr:hypothetical protein [Sphingomonas sp. CL5.1]QKS01415.1 hypothetical protein F9288_18640 [Sphingomonas sp. CL5.1]
MNGAPRVYVLDDLIAKPGEGRALLDAYMADYAPGARARGMTLEHVLVSPPLWMDDQPNTISITWSVAGAAGWWAMRHAAGADPGTTAFWEAVSDRLLGRARRFAAAPGDVEALGHG